MLCMRNYQLQNRKRRNKQLTVWFFLIEPFHEGEALILSEIAKTISTIIIFVTLKSMYIFFL